MKKKRACSYTCCCADAWMRTSKSTLVSLLLHSTPSTKGSGTEQVTATDTQILSIMDGSLPLLFVFAAKSGKQQQASRQDQPNSRKPVLQPTFPPFFFLSLSPYVYHSGCSLLALLSLLAFGSI